MLMLSSQFNGIFKFGLNALWKIRIIIAISFCFTYCGIGAITCAHLHAVFTFTCLSVPLYLV